MSTSSKDMQDKNLNYRRYEEGDHEWGNWQEQIFMEDTSYKCPTYVNRTPPCQGSCPSGEDIRGWLQIVNGIEKPSGDMTMEEYAFRRSTASNPFPSIMGRVCPAPCEDGCNRNEVEDHVGINSVEQFIGDSALEAGHKFAPATKKSGKKVAIIGGGPAGLAAAYQLLLVGHDAVIFDDRKHLGGMMRYGIPGYRTPRDVLDGEINRIIDMGVELKMETRVGVDIALKDIEKEYDAVLWAIGAQSGRGLPIPGFEEATNCISGIAFLSAFNEGRLKLATDKVIVIGGGDTSIDVASVARRLGHINSVNEKDRPENIVLGHTAHDVASSAVREGANVILMSRSPVERMNAAEHEITDALNEGVSVQGCLAPIEIVRGDDGRATALRVIKLEADGKKRIEGSEYDIPADLIVSAIGQTGEMTGFEDYGNDKGLMDADQHYQMPGKPGHFVCGDIVRPHLLTTAIGQAAIAVESIHHYFNHQELKKRPKVDKHVFNMLGKMQEAGVYPEDKYDHTAILGTDTSDFAVHNYEDRSAHEIIPVEKLFLGHFEYTERVKRHDKPVSAEDVIGNFNERMDGLAKEKAIEEANRCMSCGMCFECDNCVIYCPQDAIFRVKKGENTLGRYVDTDYFKCVGCHICADVCPTGYIDMAMGE